MGIKYFNGFVTNKNVVDDEIDRDLIDSTNNLKNIVDEKMNELKTARWIACSISGALPPTG